MTTNKHIGIRNFENYNVNDLLRLYSIYFRIINTNTDSEKKKKKNGKQKNTWNENLTCYTNLSLLKYPDKLVYIQITGKTGKYVTIGSLQHVVGTVKTKNGATILCSARCIAGHRTGIVETEVLQFYNVIQLGVQAEYETGELKRRGIRFENSMKMRAPRWKRKKLKISVLRGDGAQDSRIQT